MCRVKRGITIPASITAIPIFCFFDAFLEKTNISVGGWPWRDRDDERFNWANNLRGKKEVEEEEEAGRFDLLCSTTWKRLLLLIGWQHSRTTWSRREDDDDHLVVVVVVENSWSNHDDNNHHLMIWSHPFEPTHVEPSCCYFTMHQTTTGFHYCERPTSSITKYRPR